MHQAALHRAHVHTNAVSGSDAQLVRLGLVSCLAHPVHGLAELLAHQVLIVQRLARAHEGGLAAVGVVEDVALLLGERVVEQVSERVNE